MNKKFILSLVFSLIVCSTALIAKIENTLEFRGAAFFHANKRFRHIYANAGTSYQIETALRVDNRWEVWVNLDEFHKHGRVSGEGCRSKSSVNIFNGSFGYRAIYSYFPGFDFYLGIGPSFARLNFKNKTCCGNEIVSKVTCGGVAKGGVYINLSEGLFLDLFVDYLYQPVRLYRHINVGGLKVGAGLGLKF